MGTETYKKYQMGIFTVIALSCVLIFMIISVVIS